MPFPPPHPHPTLLPPSLLHPSSQPLHPTPYALHPTLCTLHFYTLRTTPYTLYSPLQPAACDQIAFFSFLGLHWSSSESGDLWYKSQVANETIWFRVEGVHGGARRGRELLRQGLALSRSILSHKMYLLIRFKNSTPPQNHHPIVYYYQLRH